MDLKPDLKLHCHECGYVAEVFRFRARTLGDETSYWCPLCKSAGKDCQGTLHASKENTATPTQKLEKEPVMNSNMKFVVVDFETRTVKVIPALEVPAVGDNCDLLIPMVGSLKEVESLPRRGQRDFWTQVNQLSAGIDAGEFPSSPEIDAWFRSISEQPTETDLVEGEEPMKFHEGAEEEMMEPTDIDPALFDNWFRMGFDHGFRMGQEMYKAYQNPPVHPSDEMPVDKHVQAAEVKVSPARAAQLRKMVLAAKRNRR